MTRIHHSPLLGHIDLERIVRISDPYFIDRMGSGGWFVGFTVDVQLRDEPIRYQRDVSIERGESRFDEQHLAATVDGRWTPQPSLVPHPDLLCIANLQRDIDELVGSWRNA